MPAPVETAVQAPRLSVRAGFVPNSFNEEARTVEVTWSTGARVLRGFWDRFYEELSLDPQHVRMGRMNSGAPVLNSHSSYDLGDVIGVVERAWIEQGEGRALVRFSERDDVKPIMQDVKTGILRNISVGYAVHRFEKIEGGDEEIPVYRAVDWEPHEISFVPIPADAASQVRSAPEQMNTCVFVNRGAAAEKGEGMDPKEKEEAEKRAKEARDAEIAAAEQRAREEGAAAVRQLSIDVRAAVAVLPEGQRSKVAEELLADPTMTADKARAAVLSKLAESQTEVRSQVRIEVGTDNVREGFRSGVHNAIMHRLNPGAHKLDEAGRMFRGMSLLEIARDYCERALGVSTRGMSKMDIAGLALGVAGTRGVVGMHTTSDFPNILSNIANVTLRDAYQAAPQTFKAIARQQNLPDFRVSTAVQFGEAPSLEKVNEHGEFKHGTIGEGKEQWKLLTYGKIVGFTRQLLVNDDLGALARVPQMFGRSAADLESDLVWAQVTANPVMGDGKTLFHADHGNLAAAGSAIGVDSVGAARAAMRQQKGIDKKSFISVAPRYLVVPTALETKAEQFTSTVYTPNVQGDINVFANKLVAFAEPRLDAASATAWYLFADPAQLETLIYGYLEGEEGPQIETRTGFDVDGMEIKCRLDFAAKAIEWRSAYKNPGAA